MFDIRNLTPKRKAYLKKLLETDGYNGDTQFDEEDMGSPLHKSPGRRKREPHYRKRDLNNTSLTASPASPPQPSTASRVVKKSKKADSAPSSFKIVSPVGPALVTAETVSDLITVQSNSDSDSSATKSQGKQTVVPSVSVSQPTAVRVESQAAPGTNHPIHTYGSY
jgi:hypothetical protein